MALRFVDYDVVMGLRNKEAVWARARDRLTPSAWPALRPTFKLEAGCTVYTIGSCFARNIEEHLHRLGYNIPTLEFQAPTAESPIRANGILNKYTPSSIYQEIDWAATHYKNGTIPDESEFFVYGYEVTDGMYIDNSLSQNSYFPVNRARWIERRRQLYDLAKNIFTAACVVITPGVAEAWFDESRNIFVSHNPVERHGSYTRNLKFTLLDYDECHKALNNTISIIRSINPDSKFLITTSPVPLSRTFTDMDILTANTYAKAVLRAACGKLAEDWDGMDYFPSFESVTLTKGEETFESNGSHVLDEFVGRIVARLSAAYCADVGGAEATYQRALEARDPAESLTLLQDAAEQAPHSAHYLAALGANLIDAGDLAGGRAAFRKAYDLDEGNTRRFHLLLKAAAMMKAKGDAVMGLEILREAARLEPSEPLVLQRLAVEALEAGDLKTAEANCRAVLALVPDNHRTLATLSRIMSQSGRRTEALTMLREALKTAPQSFDLLVGVGRINVALGRFVDAAVGLPPRGDPVSMLVHGRI